MVPLLVYALVLLAAVLVSERASRSVLSTSVLFLAAGFLAGNGALGWIGVGQGDAALSRVAEITLFAVLYTDGMKLGVRDLRRAWRLPGRALVLGLPLTIAATALLARATLGYGWATALLLGAVLAPTDPVFASAIVGREEVPKRIRHLLGVESGLNDGLALPLVIVLLEVLGSGDKSVPALLGETALGVAVGVAIPLAALWLERRERLAAAGVYEPIFAVAVALAVYAVAAISHANEFLAAFAAGTTIASRDGGARREFHRFGSVLAELLKLAALLLFGALLTPAYFAGLSAAGWAFAALALFAARPAALAIALAGSGLRRSEWLTVAWFGPKGFASILYAILVLHSGAQDAERLFRLIAVVVVGSIVLHSSTDVPIARWFHRHDAVRRGAGREAGTASTRRDARA